MTLGHRFFFYGDAAGVLDVIRKIFGPRLGASGDFAGSGRMVLLLPAAAPLALSWGPDPWMGHFPMNHYYNERRRAVVCRLSQTPDFPVPA